MALPDEALDLVFQGGTFFDCVSEHAVIITLSAGINVVKGSRCSVVSGKGITLEL